MGAHKTERQEALQTIDSIHPEFIKKMNGFMQEDRKKAEGSAGFENHEATWLAFKNPDVIEHFPPQYIIGKQVEDREIACYED